MKIGVVITYYNRERQLRKTLSSIASSVHLDYYVVIVDDGSSQECSFPDVTVLRTKDKTWINPVVAVNTGVHHLLKNYSSDIIIIQNAECYHVGDILSYANAHVTDKNYISFGCFSIDSPIEDYDLAQIMSINDRCVTIRGGHGWYNHPVHRPVGYDFCSAMSVSTMLKLNGHDERFKDDLGYADDDLIRRVRRLGLDLIITESPFVVHQYHKRGNRRPPVQLRNKALAATLEHSGNYRATHVVTEDFV